MENEELFFGYDIRAIWRDKRLKPFERDLLVHLIIISVDEMSVKHFLPDDQIEYEVPIWLLREKTGRATGGVGRTLRKLHVCGYVTFALVPGQNKRRCYHVILHGQNLCALLKDASITPVRIENGVREYRIDTPQGMHGSLYKADFLLKPEEDAHPLS